MHDGLTLPRSDLWAIVLAAGEGSRLRSITRDRSGRSVPKQFCALRGRPSLLRTSLTRAQSLVPPERCVTIVSADHRRWWKPEISRDENVVVQPRNLGTALGILLPLLWIRQRDPAATILVFPSDHFIARERIFLDSVCAAVHQSFQHPDRLALIGVSPAKPEPGYGWILPGDELRGGGHAIREFHEKPESAQIAALMDHGAVVNSFVFAVTAETLLDLYRRYLPEVTHRFLEGFQGVPPSEEQIEKLYRAEGQSSVDFSSSILEQAAERLILIRAGDCGWTDLGTRERLMSCVGATGGRGLVVPKLRTPSTLHPGVTAQPGPGGSRAFSLPR